MLEFDARKVEQGARTLDRNMITAANSLARLQLADTFRGAATRHHHAEPFCEPMRQTQISEPCNPGRDVRMGELMRQDGGKPLTLIGEQDRRQAHTAQEHDADRPRTACAIGSNEGFTRRVHAKRDRTTKWTSVDGFHSRSGGG